VAAKKRKSKSLQNIEKPVPNRKPKHMTLEQMDDAIAEAVIEKFKRVSRSKTLYTIRLK
jgi:hypothetical protein